MYLFPMINVKMDASRASRRYIYIFLTEDGLDAQTSIEFYLKGKIEEYKSKEGALSLAP